MGPLTGAAVVVSSRRASNGVSSAICLASGECFSEERAFAAESTENCCQAFPGVGVIKGRRSVTFGTEDTSSVLPCSTNGLGDFDFLVFPFCLSGIVRNGGEGGFWGFSTFWFSVSRLAGYVDLVFGAVGRVAEGFESIVLDARLSENSFTGVVNGDRFLLAGVFEGPDTRALSSLDMVGALGGRPATAATRCVVFLSGISMDSLENRRAAFLVVDSPAESWESRDNFWLNMLVSFEPFVFSRFWSLTGRDACFRS